MTTLLIIPDSHATPTHNNDRFTWLGRLILDRKPDIIVNIGDMADMPSLCSYDKGKKSFEGRRYKKDIESVIDAQEKLFAPINEYNQRQKETRHRQYRPELFLTTGNHEARISRAVESQAELEGTISVEDLRYKDFGWTVIPYLEPLILEGVAFCHYFSSGVMGKAIGGEHQAHSLIMKKHMSCVQGHTHTRDFCERVTADGRRIMSLVVGCYLDEDQHEDYAGEANKLWWRGVVMLHDVQDGQFEPEFISVKKIKESYA